MMLSHKAWKSRELLPKRGSARASPAMKSPRRPPWGSRLESASVLRDYRYRLFTLPQVALWVGVPAGHRVPTPPCQVTNWRTSCVLTSMSPFAVPGGWSHLHELNTMQTPSWQPGHTYTVGSVGSGTVWLVSRLAFIT